MNQDKAMILGLAVVLGITLIEKAKQKKKVIEYAKKQKAFDERFIKDIDNLMVTLNKDKES